MLVLDVDEETLRATNLVNRLSSSQPGCCSFDLGGTIEMFRVFVGGKLRIEEEEVRDLRTWNLRSRSVAKIKTK